MAEIIIGQYQGTSFFSKLIKWRTWSNISHTGAFLGDDVIEAWGGGVVRQHWTSGHEPGTKITLYRVPCLDKQWEIFYSFLLHQVGKKYDKMGILGFMTRAKSQHPDKWFCSELVFAAAKEAGIDLLARIEPYQVSPGQLDTSPILEFVENRICP